MLKVELEKELQSERKEWETEFSRERNLVSPKGDLGSYSGGGLETNNPKQYGRWQCRYDGMLDEMF